MSEPFLGEINLFAGNFAPRGWALCRGQLLPIGSNTALFALIGTTYGGDGRVTFALPNLQGRVPIGAGAGPGLTRRVQGSRGGDEIVTLSTAQIPSHTHGVTLTPELGASTGNADSHEPSPTTVLAVPTVQGAPGLNAYSSLPLPPDTDIEGASATVVASATGGGQSHTNMAPFNVLNYIIALIGVFPSRD